MFRCRGEAGRRRHPAEGTGGRFRFQLTTDGGCRGGTAAVFRDLPRREVHPDVRTEKPHRRRTRGADPDPGCTGHPTTLGQLPPVVVFPARGADGRSATSTPTTGTRATTRSEAGAVVVSVDYRLAPEYPYPGRSRRCLGRNAMGGRAPPGELGGRPQPACRCRRLSGQANLGGPVGGTVGPGCGAGGPLPIRFPAAVVSGHDVRHVAAIVSQRMPTPPLLDDSAIKGFFPLVCRRFGSLGYAPRRWRRHERRNLAGLAPGVHRSRGPRPAGATTGAPLRGTAWRGGCARRAAQTQRR